MNAPLVIYEEDYKAMCQVCDRLVRDANARAIYVVDKSGQVMASSGEADTFDATSLAALVAGEIAATGGLAKLIGERDFSVLFHEGVKDNIHISLVGSRGILVVIFDKRSNLGLVRLRVKKASEELNKILDVMQHRAETQRSRLPFNEITDEEIDNLFAD